MAGGAFTALVNLRGKRDETQTERARLDEETRRQDINLIIQTLQEEVASLRVVVRSHEETIESLRRGNYDLLGDKAQLGNEVRRLTIRVKELEGKIN